MPGYRAVLLDLDGCLLDSNREHASAWRRALGRFGRRVSASRIAPHIGKGGKELLRDFVSPAELHFLGDALGRTQTDLYLRRFRSVRPFPGVRKTVHAMHAAGIRVVIASSADRQVLERSLERLRLGRAIAGWTSADDVEKAKPFQDIFQLAIRRFRLARRNPVAIGDTPYDIAAAHQIGVPCLALRSGGFPRAKLASAEAIFENLSDLWRSGRPLFA